MARLGNSRFVPAALRGARNQHEPAGMTTPPGWPPGCPKCGNEDATTLFLKTVDVAPQAPGYPWRKRILGNLCGRCDHCWPLAWTGSYPRDTA